MINIDKYLANKQAQQERNSLLAAQTARYATQVLEITVPQEDMQDTFSQVFSSNAPARDVYEHPLMSPPDVEFSDPVAEEDLWKE